MNYKLRDKNQISIPRPHLFINNEFCDSNTTLAVCNPSNGELITYVNIADSNDIEKAVMAARLAFDSGIWPQCTAIQRKVLLEKLASNIEDSKMEIATLESLDTGKPLLQSLNVDVAMALDQLNYYASLCDKVPGR